ncbi:MAG: DUF3656 domain-containing U32 family peptidase [Clostridia bacterium]
MIELLSPVGNFECLKAAVQNGADSIYLGADTFSARAFASNFSLPDLEKAIQYAKLRGVKTHLTLNTLITDDEIDDAIMVAKKAYEFGIDAIIVQDLGLATLLIKNFPDLPIHASTQMTVHNLNGALELQDLGFKRIVLSRELSINEIAHICKNTSVEIETFIHGALCISYSGQCLFSSMLGGRSGNRGKCAGPCRLPFELLENNTSIDSGYLLSTKDLCGLDYIPELINAGVTSFKIEGRMKSPFYVATVTKIYRKYIDLALSDNDYIISPEDRKILLQVFNRGMSSSGHLSNEGNRNLVFKEKPNNMGLFLGKIQKYNSKKGYITIKLNEPIEIGDTISLEQETGSYTISELMDMNHNNITSTKIGQTVIIGRMKGNIKLGSKIYKMSSKQLNLLAHKSYSQENKKILLNCHINIHKDSPISISVTSANNLELYKDLNLKYTSDVIPITAKNRPIDKDSIISKISKTNTTPYTFQNISIDLDDNLFIPKISSLNDLRRNILSMVEQYILNVIKRGTLNTTFSTHISSMLQHSSPPKISLLLNILNDKFDYSNLNQVDSLYIPLKYFCNKKFDKIFKDLSNKFNLYIYMPTIVKSNYSNLLSFNLESTLTNFDIKGFVISNICNIKFLENLLKPIDTDLDIIANYTFNIYNSNTINEFKKLGVSRYTISPELNRNMITNLCSDGILPSELIVYGKTPLINMNYCPLGETDKCYPTCTQKCLSDNSYFLKDRLNMKFTIIPDNIQTVTTIFNSKITSIYPNEFNIDFARIDILDENIDEINNIITTVRNNQRFEGNNYTNGNLNKEL